MAWTFYAPKGLQGVGSQIWVTLLSQYLGYTLSQHLGDTRRSFGFDYSEDFAGLVRAVFRLETVGRKAENGASGR